jgi:hypothetical protein
MYNHYRICRNCVSLSLPLSVLLHISNQSTDILFVLLNRVNRNDMSGESCRIVSICGLLTEQEVLQLVSGMQSRNICALTHTGR